jgi:hypothetical protein
MSIQEIQPNISNAIFEIQIWEDILYTQGNLILIS